MLEIKNEADLRRESVKALRKLGYTVLIVGGGLPRCTKCGSRVTTGNGSSPGVPDLLVTHSEYPEAMWLGIELKWANGQLRAAQQKLKDSGDIIVCRSVESVVDCCERWRTNYEDY